jgi:hypothetical protein
MPRIARIASHVVAVLLLVPACEKPLPPTQPTSAASTSTSTSTSASASAQLMLEQEPEAVDLAVFGALTSASVAKPPASASVLGPKLNTSSGDPPGKPKFVADVATGAVVGAAAAGIADADVTIARNRWRFKACYHKALALDPTVKGSLSVYFKVDKTGEVISASLTGSSVPAALGKCVRDGFLPIKFGPATNPDAPLTVPIVFSVTK